MRFVKSENVDLKKHYKNTKLKTLLDRFLESDYEIGRVEYEDGEYVSVWSAAAAIKKSIARFRMANVKCFVHNGIAYIMKVLPDDCQ